MNIRWKAGKLAESDSAAAQESQRKKKGNDEAREHDSGRPFSIDCDCEPFGSRKSRVNRKKWADWSC